MAVLFHPHPVISDSTASLPSKNLEEIVVMEARFAIEEATRMKCIQRGVV